jgi:sugar phosphate isomerase/epimerase
MPLRTFARRAPLVLAAAFMLTAPLTAGPSPAARPDPFDRDNLVAWCIVPFDARKRSPEDRAAMLKRLGFTRFAYDWRAEHLPTFERELAALKANDIRLTAVWFPGGLDRDGRFILDALKKHNLRTQLWVMLTDPAPGKDQQAKVKAAADRIAPLAREALKLGHKVGLYNHGGWGGEPENQLAVIGAVNLPNVGVVYNLHHGHDHLDRFPEVLKRLKPHLYCLNLNGMVKGGDKAGRKILPLGQGDLDLSLLKAIRDSGYRGPIGIIGHTDDDAEARLKDNLDGLDWLLPQLDGQPAGPKPTPRTAAKGPTIRLTPGGAVEVAGLPAPPPKGSKWDAALQVVVVGGDGSSIPGAYAADGDALRFTPRFPLTPGVTYRATFDPARLPGGNGQPVTADLVVPKPKREPTTVVAQVYPVAETLPENTLRLYVRFSAPMTHGGVYKHIKLLCGGEEVAHPFLELDEELWSADGKRFTLLFDPGRVKRGLKPREEVGPSLEEGKAYTLVIDRAWEDENGVPLKGPFRKSFSVGPPDDTPIDPDRWAITPPTAAAPRLAVKLDKPLDHELLHRMVWVVGPGGQKLDGTLEVPDRADAWSFRPAGDKWPPGEYKLVIDTRLEDPCGNRVGRPFEVDVFKPVPKKVEGRTVERRFTVR